MTDVYTRPNLPDPVRYPGQVILVREGTKARPYISAGERHCEQWVPHTSIGISEADVSALKAAGSPIVTGITILDPDTNDPLGTSDGDGDVVEGGPGGPTPGFTDLTDAPSSYADQAGRPAVVADTEDGLTYDLPPGTPLRLEAGPSTDPEQSAGVVTIKGGTGAGGGGGNVDIQGGPDTDDGAGSGGDVILKGGRGLGGGGSVRATGAADDGSGAGYVYLTGGENSDQEGGAGSVVIKGGASPGGTTGDGGDVTLQGGTSDSGDPGNIKLLALPTSNPGVANAVWNDGGTLKISAG